MVRASQPISCIKAAHKEFEKFPAEAQSICLTALTVAAECSKADIAKPMSGLGRAFSRSHYPFAEMPFA